jgi:tRNA 2-thiouridine synthesizing protein E
LDTTGGVLRMDLEISGRIVQTDEQGYLLNLNDWSEEFAEKMAERDGVRLFDDHWGLILYFRDHFQATGSVPTMHTLVRTLGQQHGTHFQDEKTYGKFLYRLFPSDPVRELCKLAGLPKPPPDT